MGDSIKWAVPAVVASVVMAAVWEEGASRAVCADLAFLERALIVALLVAASAHDMQTRIIPNHFAAGMLALHAFLVLVGAHYGGLDPVAAIAASAVGAIVIGGGMLAFTLAFERFTGTYAMGGGDLKLLGALGFALGWQGAAAVLLLACALFATYVSGLRLKRTVAGCVADGAGLPASIAASRCARRGAGEAFPFVPSLACAAFLISLIA